MADKQDTVVDEVVDESEGFDEPAKDDLFDVREPEDLEADVDPKAEADDSEPEDGADESPKGEEDDSKVLDELLARAAAAGLESEDLEGLDEAAMDRVIKVAERMRKASEHDTAAPKGDEGAKDAKPKGDRLQLNPDLFEPELVDVIDRIQEFYDEKISTLAAKVEALTGDIGRQRMDASFSGLPKEWHSVFGDGATVLQTGDELKNRVRLLEEMEALRAGYSKIGRPEPSDAELFQAALRTQFGDFKEQLSRKRLQANLGKRQKNFINRPGSPNVKSRPESSETIATRNLRAKMASMGLTDEGYGDAFD